MKNTFLTIGIRMARLASVCQEGRVITRIYARDLEKSMGFKMKKITFILAISLFGSAHANQMNIGMASYDCLEGIKKAVYGMGYKWKWTESDSLKRFTKYKVLKKKDGATFLFQISGNKLINVDNKKAINYSCKFNSESVRAYSVSVELPQ